MPKNIAKKDHRVPAVRKLVAPIVYLSQAKLNATNKSLIVARKKRQDNIAKKLRLREKLKKIRNQRGRETKEVVRGTFL
jgi:hypothetical protein